LTPEPYPLTFTDWKIKRAKFHLDSLNQAVDRYLSPEPGDLEPYSMTSHEEPEEDSVCYQVKVNHPHIYIFLIASDALQNLRSALDHAVWSLVNQKFPNPDWTQFPIWEKRPADERGRERFMGFMRGLNDKSIAYIESLQPYNRPAEVPVTSLPLWQLNELNRIEKHRKVLVRTSIHIPFRVVRGVGNTVAPELGDMIQIPTDYGYDVTCTGRYKYLEPRISPIVVFGEETSGISITVDGLWNIYNFVGETLIPTLAGLAQQSS
jgi:hypothetical protein